MKHNCKELRKFRGDSYIEVVIRLAVYDGKVGVWQLILIDNKEDGRFAGIGAVISYCPFCGKKLESGK